ncbi:MAG: polysaccharide biosynthesis/export family protein, partial [Acidobacteria bacterium]|nr:polysaccharide biosynthesis/export family protein [Acidobacteriota bacterium]
MLTQNVLFLNSFSTFKALGQETPKDTVKNSEVSEQNKNKQSDSVRNYRIVPTGNKEQDTSERQTSQNNKANDNYTIGFQDRLDISVVRHPELNQVVNVGPDGTILMPHIDQPIDAACKTERELKAYIEALYRKNYLRNPFVNVRVSEQRSQAFAVIGAVEKPGDFYLNRRVRLLELLALAGGQDVEKAGSRIKVTKMGNVSGCQNTEEKYDENAKVEFIDYNLNDVLEGKQNPWMQPGDIVSVLEAQEAYVVGEVKEPTKIQLKEPVTLTQAIAKAGGLEKNAKTEKVIIQRQESGSQAKT